MFVKFYWTTQYYNQEDSHLCTHCHNLKSYFSEIIFEIYWLLHHWHQRVSLSPRTAILHELLLRSWQASNGGIELSFQFQSFTKKGNIHIFIQNFFILLQVEGRTAVSQSIINFINFVFFLHHIWFVSLSQHRRLILTPTAYSNIFQLT